ncbi:hypothetical protein A0H81_10251 [Grifola frondosa]|uniref:Uncharacterized protein n=1 Tax=Grifola frondosa TaxID=5627 RepID=A0A1C7LYY4_GRIFR|nr:hypothetical protein A0H81_10251 [Grifola frondosa]
MPADISVGTAPHLALQEHRPVARSLCRWVSDEGMTANEGRRRRSPAFHLAVDLTRRERKECMNGHLIEKAVVADAYPDPESALPREGGTPGELRER